MIFIFNHQILSTLFWIYFLLNISPWLLKYDTYSNIDWCEDNYSNSYYVAEFYNSISMIPGILLLLFDFSLIHHDEIHLYPLVCYFLSIWISIGSFMFHATLNRFWQAQDELPMLYLGIWTFFCAFKLYNHEIYYSYFIFVIICGIITRLYCSSTSYSDFIIPYIIITMISLSMILYHILYLCECKIKKRVGLTGIYSISIVLPIWLIDLFFCSSWKLHAIWHLGTSITQYTLIKYLSYHIH